MNFKAWLHSAAAAAIGAVSAAITTTIASPSTFNLTPDGLKHLGGICLVSAVLAVAALLKQSPRDPDSAPSSAFSKGVATIALVSLLCSTMTGCTPEEKQQTVISVTQDLQTGLVALYNIEGKTALAATLQTDLGALVTAETNWKNGSPVQDVIQADQVIQSDLNLLPVDTKTDELIDLGLGFLDQILVLLPSAEPAVTEWPVITGVTLSRAAFVRTAATPGLHHRLAKPITSRKDFKKRWNAIVKKHPELAAAKLK